jgi:serine phosphatase RsbU (regulator of sigma subunit)
MRNFDVQVPVIVVAEDRDVDSMATALGLGAADFFVRPQERPGLLRHAIGRCVTHHRLQRELKESKENLERTNQELRHSLRMLQQDQQAGRQVQMALLPSGSLQVNGFWFSQKIFTSLYLSGDFADYFQVSDDQVVFFLADVSGHGSSSAFATVLLKNLFARKRSDYLRRQDTTVTSPVKMLSLANSELLELELNKYATMVVGSLNFKTGALTYSVAGHLPLPILLTHEGIHYLEGEGPPVGLVPDAVYEASTIQMPDEFILSVLSDGILELLDDKDLLEKEAALLKRLEGSVAKPSELWKRLGLDHVDRNHLPDDVAVLFISRGLA